MVTCNESSPFYCSPSLLVVTQIRGHILYSRLFFPLTHYCSCLAFLFERSKFLIATWQKKNLRVCSTNLGFSGVVKTLLLSHATTVWYQVRTYHTLWYQVRIMYQIRTYVMFRPWTHTSDDSYIYQLSLVVATATVSLSSSCQKIRLYGNLQWIFALLLLSLPPSRNSDPGSHTI